ncbi:MAG TPA: (2Fe-2S) ferredoxin domain-containing protein [Clostridiales bacterium]|nr:(2Fe-2S) ferredoxin domain-containing protein [Clostridiales bacterium]
MKSLEELEEIRKKTLESVNIRTDRKNTRVVVGMGTCGIAAGARPVLLAFLEEINKRNLNDVIVTQTGCIGVCRLEPIVEVYTPGEEKVTYVKMTPEKVRKIVSDHIVNGQVVKEYTIGAYEEQDK